MSEPSKPIRLGNLYAIMAAVAAAQVTPGRGEPMGVVVQLDGTIDAFNLRGDESDRLLKAPGFVGWLSEDTDPQRFAQRLAAAHAKVMAS